MPDVSVTKKQRAGNGGLTRLLGWEPMFEGSMFQLNPFSLMRRFTEDLEKSMGPASGEMAQIAEWRPAMEISEEKGMLVVKADLPGIKEEDVKVSVADGMLTVEGERKHEKKTEEEGYFRSERAFGRFCRTISLPDGADLDNASAKFANGVLEVEIPIPEVMPQRKEIPIKGAAKEEAAASQEKAAAS
jgi:HSP20 family protein